MTVVHRRQQQMLTAKVRSLDEATKIVLEVVKARLGVAVRPVTARKAERYRLEAQHGVSIAWIEPREP